MTSFFLNCNNLRTINTFHLYQDKILTKKGDGCKIMSENLCQKISEIFLWGFLWGQALP